MLESRFSIGADQFEAYLARTARNVTNTKITSAFDGYNASYGEGRAFAEAACHYQ